MSRERYEACKAKLISSWLDRTARFYGRPVQVLLAQARRSSRLVDLSALDLGTSRTALAPIAALLGISVEQVAVHTVAAGYSWAMGGLVVRGASGTTGHRRAPLRYAACPYCLEQQNVARGFSWRRREWVLAPRTVCQHHGVPLVEGDGPG